MITPNALHRTPRKRGGFRSGVTGAGSVILVVRHNEDLPVIFLAMACLASLTYAADEKPAPDATVVRVLDKPLPHAKDKRERFLWDNFANKPDEQKFGSYTTEKWKDNYAVFAKALVQKADDQKLDSASLRKALDLVLKDSKGLPCLPVGAYQTTLDGKQIWILTVKWEALLEGKHLELSHIRIFAFDQKTLKQVGFVTCG